MVKRILIIILILLIIGQFFQPPHNNGAAAAATDITHAVQVPDTIMRLLKVSCYDCHSDHTIYPWYSKITPVNWWLNSHINDGKRALNFTHFTTYTYKKQNHRMDDISKTVKEHDMPLNSYLWIHTNAKLNASQQKMIIDWAEGAKKQVMEDSLRSPLSP